MIDDRRRLSSGFLDEHTSQSQAITGTPCEVPVPRNVIFKRQFELISKSSLLLHFTVRMSKKLFKLLGLSESIGAF